jgi:hypothetical protein
MIRFEVEIFLFVFNLSHYGRTTSSRTVGSDDLAFLGNPRVGVESNSRSNNPVFLESNAYVISQTTSNL